MTPLAGSFILLEKGTPIKNFHHLYEQVGAYHHEAQGFKSWFLKDNYLAIAGECAAQSVVLDLACGEGCLGPYLDARRLVGIDYSEKALELNRRLHPNVYDDLLQADLRSMDRLRLPPASFEYVVCSLSLMYLAGKGLGQCLKETFRLVKPGGAFICTYPTVGPSRNGNREAAEVTPEQLKSRLQEAGFAVERMDPICPFLPKEAVERSQNDPEVLEIYRRAKEKMTLETSYHFLCAARKG